MKWNDELIEQGILEVVKQLNLDRMPTGDELKTVGMNALHCKISRTLKYSGWAERLGLELKSGSTTRKGTAFEIYVTKWLESYGFKVEQTSHKHPYDLYVDDSVKIDIKVSSPYTSKNGTKHIFAGMKGSPTCDIFILVALDENDGPKYNYVVPSHRLSQHTVNVWEGELKPYVNTWEIVQAYSNFYKKM
jgi:hypothetical protein